MMNLGISRAEFIDNYFEKNFFVRKQAFTNHGVEWRHVNEALFSWDPREGLISLYKDGKVPLEKFVEPFQDVGMQRFRIVKDVFNDYLRNGATLVLNRLDIKSLPIHRLKMEIARYVGEKAATNGYVAFGGKGTFAKHWDTHDVFAVQLIGRKRWKVFKPTFPLPLPHQKSKEHKHECPEEPVFDGILEAGDVLYLPRGWWHEAIPLENEETFHIAVGIHTAHVADYVAWSCGNALAQVVDFRKTLKFEGDNKQEFQDALTHIHNLLLDPVNIQEFKSAQIEHDRVISEFAIEKSGRGVKPELALHNVISVNSPYGAKNVFKSITSNGFSINFDDVTARALQGLILGEDVSIGQVMENITPSLHGKVENLIFELLRRDIVAIKNIN